MFFSLDDVVLNALSVLRFKKYNFTKILTTTTNSLSQGENSLPLKNDVIYSLNYHYI